MKVIITGGAGFIGCNAVRHYLDLGHDVVIVDNLSRKGTRENLTWLESLGHRNLQFEKCDLRDFERLAGTVKAHKDASVVLHLAGQVAVTTSVQNPREDFEINALGTFNVLESVRLHAREALVIYSSTNKVYGGMETVGVEERGGRYQFKTLTHGVSEDQPLDFHSPYGCSKGAADQYVRDYARIYGLRSVCLRQSCIYGYRQFGVEDQGWVAWFTIASVLGKPVTIYGDGKQVRDVLFIEDLCALYLALSNTQEGLHGEIFNVGGGEQNQMSLLELIAFLEEFGGRKIVHSFDRWRPGDQPVFVSDISLVGNKLGWRPKVSVRQGVEKLYKWVSDNRGLFS